jgi:hypothetical protein
MSAPKRHNLDRFADDLIGNLANRDPDELLDSRTLARLIHVSVPWLEIGRLPKDPNDPSKGHRYGPDFVRINKRVIRYRVRDVLKWLGARSKKPER